MQIFSKYLFIITINIFFTTMLYALDVLSYPFLDNNETAYLKSKKEIKIYLTKDWSPSDDLEFPPIYGFLKDYLKLFGKKIGKKIVFTKKVDDHYNSVDLIAAIHKDKKYKNLLYSKYSIYDVYYAFAIPLDKEIPTLEKLNKDKDTLAIVQNFEKIDYIRKKYPDIRLIECATNLDALKFVLQKKASYAFGNYYILEHLIYKNFLSGLKIKLQSKNKYLSITKKYLAFTKNNMVLKNIFDKIYNDTDKEEIYLLKLKWLPQPTARKVILTKKEKSFIKNHIIKINTTISWIPFNFSDDQGNIIGIGVDYWKLIAKKAHIKYKFYKAKSFPEVLKNIKTKKFDVNIATSQTIDKSSFAIFSKTYEKFPIAIATKKINSFITTGVELEHKKVAVGKSYSTYYLLKSMFPKIEFILTEDTKEALELVKNGEAFAAVDIEPSLRYQIINNNFDNLYITGITGVDFNLQVMARDDYNILISIINKAINAINNQERIEIYKKWMGVKRKKTNFKLIMQIVAFFIVIIAILMYSYTKQKRLKKELEELNKTLEKKIQIALNKEKKRHLDMLQQKRLAQMGEALSMIAHQWKQPLNALIFLNATLVNRYKNNKLTLDMINEFEQRSNKIIRGMSQTVDNFRNFFKPKKSKETFYINDAIKECIEIVKPLFEEQGIKISLDLQEGIKVFGYKNEFGQAILNIINNSKDAFREKDVKDKKIQIKLFSQDDKDIITIEDNAGGIDQKYLDKIFEPYFTTKESKGGDGIGLYMTKLIIEKHMKGNIKIENTSKGVKATIFFEKNSKK